MKRTWATVLAGLVLAACGGCASSRMAYDSASMAGDPFAGGEEPGTVRPQRMLIWEASLSLEVPVVSNAVAQVRRIADAAGGYVERQSGRGETQANLSLRVPASKLSSSVGALEALGHVVARSILSEDVTEEYVDVEARLKNKAALRDRLKQLLDKAVDVKDVLAIEAELSRVQSDLDAMQARIKSLAGQVEMASLDVSLTRRKILGPLGYAFKGLWWSIAKLFVIQG